MAYLICLFFPTFISLRKIIKKNDNILNIIIKYTNLNIVINFFSFLIVWLFTNSNSVINNSIMTIPFFIKYLLISSMFALFLPNIYNFLKNNFKIKIERK